METKKIKDLTMMEIDNICFDIYECAKCPLLISSRKRIIVCLRDETIPIIDAERVCELMEKEIEIEKNKE